MCNAYSLTRSRDEVAAWLRGQINTLYDPPQDYRPRYRVGPRQQGLIATADAVGVASWGFVPAGVPSDRRRLWTNARDDKVQAGGWPWKLAVRKGRCLVISDGFFEPEKRALDKSPAPWSYYRLADGGLFAMAGLCIDGTYTVITTAANAAIRVHDRMPVILDPEEARAWLTADDPPLDLLRPYPADRMTGHRVGNAAKSSRAPDGPDLVAPVTALL